MTEPVRSERAQLSPADRAARIRRCARALKSGTTGKALRTVYSDKEIAAARKMLEPKE